MLKKTKIVIFSKGPAPKHTFKVKTKFQKLLMNLPIWVFYFQNRDHSTSEQAQKACTVLLEKYDYFI